MKKFKRLRPSTNEPIISIRDGRFNYNSVFYKLAEMHLYKYVHYFIDEELNEIGFQFYNDNIDSDCYCLYTSSGKKRSIRSSAGEIINRNNWISKIHNSEDSDLKNFKAREHNGKWIISLMPAFENSFLKEKIPYSLKNTKGIYQYLDKKGQVVYIGKGNIFNRLKSPERKEWHFHKVEYSIIDNEDKQFEWEDFWLENFKDKNNGKLPLYNLISGHKR